MFKSRMCGLMFLCAFFSSFTGVQAKEPSTVGIFKSSDPRLEGLKWGNWGSRPYEYEWISSVAPLQGKKVIDLGGGLPSQYNWCYYVINELKPSFYAGVDADRRILKEEANATGIFEIRHMDMSKLEYPDQSFDLAYCISTFEHIPYETFMKSIQEAHRVLKDGGLLIFTLDEQWDKNSPRSVDNCWNDLEFSLINRKLFDPYSSELSFSLPNFLDLIKDYFVLSEKDAVVNVDSQTITSKLDPSKFYYKRTNADSEILYSPLIYNSSVSYAVVEKK